MSSQTVVPTTTGSTSRSLQAGTLAGLAGGLVFGMMMAMMGMMPMIAMLVGSKSTLVGWLLHMAISAFAGVGFALLARGQSNVVKAIGLGAAYGVAWWVVGALVLMPARMGMPIFAFNEMSMQSLMGHVLFGIITGATYAALIRRSA